MGRNDGLFELSERPCPPSVKIRRLPKEGIDKTSTQNDIKKNIIDTLDEVSARLGNTRAICRKYYVHPQIITLYEENKLNRYLDELTDGETDKEKVELSPDEKVLMRILKTL